jgi:abortive infection bacteriophage resistance protein
MEKKHYHDRPDFVDCKTCGITFKYEKKHREYKCDDCQAKYRKEYNAKYRKSAKAKARARERQRANLQKTNDTINKIKLERGCEICGLKSEHPEIYDFHHKDPATKVDSVARLKCSSRDKALEEIKKCVCICANCHRIHHAKFSS